MNEHDTLSVWDRYRKAKQAALAAPEDKEKQLTLEELEQAIAEIAASRGIPETGMPPRAIVHPSRQSQLERWFYRILLILFFLLVAGLAWWGNQQAA
jgi:hypothetical protein